MIRVGVVGATGYAGEELLALLLRHPKVKITSVTAKIDKVQPISVIFPKFANRIDLLCKEPEVEEIAHECDLVFLALPHTVSMEIVPALMGAGKTVIDLSADYRLKDIKQYEKFYNTVHKDVPRISTAVYGLPELYRSRIKKAKLIANPGCYPTVSILSVAPLLEAKLIDIGSIIIDAKSGVTGAGRKLAEGFLFSEINEDFKAYKINNHQHSPEINQELSNVAGTKVEVIFVPHLLPLNRGILATIYTKKAQGKTAKAAGKDSVISVYKKFYAKEPFVRIKEEGSFPRLKDVAGTNFCDIGIKEDDNSIIIVAAIDNLLKGAAGQAVQNMNIIAGLDEMTGLA
ncbi:MAG: N-acetyl-gamma-glutamyl-phosphate reductase [Candidatus Omnitrophota bacterium]